MNKILILLTLFCLLTISATTAHSATYAWTSRVYVRFLYPLDNSFVFATEGNVVINKNSSCQGETNKNNFIILTDDPNYKAKVASIMLAFETGRPLKLLYQSDYKGCYTPVKRFSVWQ